MRSTFVAISLIAIFAVAGNATAQPPARGDYRLDELARKYEDHEQRIVKLQSDLATVQAVLRQHGIQTVYESRTSQSPVGGVGSQTILPGGGVIGSTPVQSAPVMYYTAPPMMMADPFMGGGSVCGPGGCGPANSGRRGLFGRRR